MTWLRNKALIRKFFWSNEADFLVSLCTHEWVILTDFNLILPLKWVYYTQYLLVRNPVKDKLIQNLNLPLFLIPFFVSYILSFTQLLYLNFPWALYSRFLEFNPLARSHKKMEKKTNEWQKNPIFPLKYEFFEKFAHLLETFVNSCDFF